MGTLLELLDTLVDISDLYQRYGLKGCALLVLAVIVIIGGIIGLAYFFGSA